MARCTRVHVLGNRSRGYYGEVNGEVYMSTCARGNRLRGHYGEVNGEVYTCACTGEQVT